jgi:hypothetical protein
MLLEKVDVDAKNRKIIWEDGKRLSITASVLSRIGIKAPPMIAVMAPLGVGRNGRFERCGGWGKAGANASAKSG